ncbi:MAG: GNAT family N-acetyltransferase [Microthrixaceae bacterium]
MIELSEEPYDTEVATSLVAALNAEVVDRYAAPGAIAAQDDESYHAEVTPELVSRPLGVFVVAYLAGDPAGCGALKPFDGLPGVAEVKRMYTVPAARRRGVSGAVLARLETIAWDLGYLRMQLETGTAQPEAIALYERRGWHRIEAYGPYCDSPMSVCFAKDIRSS